jgi:hypothetical protein
MKKVYLKKKKKLKMKKINLVLRRPKVGDGESLLTLFLYFGLVKKYFVDCGLVNWKLDGSMELRKKKRKKKGLLGRRG